jgi:hypothetical protein
MRDQRPRPATGPAIPHRPFPRPAIAQATPRPPFQRPVPRSIPPAGATALLSHQAPHGPIRRPALAADEAPVFLRAGVVAFPAEVAGVAGVAGEDTDLAGVKHA